MKKKFKIIDCTSGVSAGQKFGGIDLGQQMDKESEEFYDAYDLIVKSWWDFILPEYIAELEGEE